MPFLAVLAVLLSMTISPSALAQADPYRAAIMAFQACLRDSARSFDDERSDIASVGRAILSICGKEHDAMISEMVKRSGGKERPFELGKTLRDSLLDEATKAVLLARINRRPKP